MKSEVIWENDAVTKYLDVRDWKSQFRVHVLITNDDGIYSVVALNLPGAGSCGDTEAEALQNAVEAIRGVLDEYTSAEEEIPWTDSTATEIPPGASHKWIVIDA